MKKKILIEVISPEIITNPPQPDTMNVSIDGLEPMEVIMLLSQVVAQFAAKELPPVIQIIKETKAKLPPATTMGLA